MDFVVKKGDLLKELQYAQGVVEKRTTVPVLSNILLETQGNALVVTATDLDATIQCGCPATVKVSGALTVSARKLFDIVRLLPDADIHFKTASEGWVNVTCERARFKIGSLSRDSFPDLPEIAPDRVTLPGSIIRTMINRCIFAITQEESRFALNGALMILRPKSISLVTTDGHRLAMITHDTVLGAVDSEMRNLVPRKTLVELSKLAADDVESVEFGKSENHLFFKVGERLLVSRVLSGQFPNFDLVLPKDNKKEVTLNTLDFSDAVRRVAVMADEESKAIRLSVKEGQLDLSSSGGDIGEAKEVVPAKYEDEPMVISFNAYYLLDFLTGLESEEVVLALRDEEYQGLLLPRSQGNFFYQYVIMPMKL